MIEIGRCPSCTNPDPVEDTRAEMMTGANLWMCSLCNERWAMVNYLPRSDVANHAQAMFDMVNDTRVRLTVANYTIQEIATSPSVFRMFESEALTNGGHSVNGSVTYAGLPVVSDPSLTVDGRDGSMILRLRLRGGPEYRPRSGPPLSSASTGVPEIEAYQASRPEYVGQIPPRRDLPAVAGTVVDPPYIAYPNPAETAGSPFLPPYIPGRTNLTMETQRVEPRQVGTLLDEMAPPPLIQPGSRWVNRSTGDVVEIVKLGRSAADAYEEPEPVVHVKKVSDDLEPGAVILQRDFETMFRPFQHASSRRDTETVVEVLKDEEWEHIETRDVVKIDSVDTKRNLVIIITKEKRKSVPMRDFVEKKWRKIVRRTAYDRLLEDD
jgi:ribosomal protein L37AE/L43A